VSENQGKIYKAIPKIMEEIGAIGKGRKNVQQNYAFRGIDDIYNAAQSALIKEGVFCVPEVLDMRREQLPSKSGGTLLYTVLTIKYTFFADDGSSVSTVVTGEGMDSGDKSCNKAMSGGQKYAFFQVFCIPTEEPKDSENETPEVGKTEPKKLLSAAELVDKMTTAKNLFELKARYSKYSADIKALEGEDKVKVTIAKDKRKVALQEEEKERKGAANA
jgi:ERF superfamily